MDTKQPKKRVFTLSKDERLKSKKLIDELFLKGKSVSVFPFKAIYLESELSQSGNPQILFTIPKRSFKKAVDRNRIRRQLKEIYRVNKGRYFTEDLLSKQLSLGIIYLGKEKISFDILEKKLNLLLERLIVNIKF